MSGTIRKVPLSDVEEARDNKIVVLGRDDISTSESAVLVDLSDTVNYPHRYDGRIDISYLKAVIDPSANSVGALRIGVITRIDENDADISYLFNVPFGKSQTRITSINNFSPSQIKFGIQGGALLFGITIRNETGVAAVNSVTQLDSPIGEDSVLPEVGDVIVKYLHTSGLAWDALIEAFYHSNPTVL